LFAGACRHCECYFIKCQYMTKCIVLTKTTIDQFQHLFAHSFKSLIIFFFMIKTLTGNSQAVWLQFRYYGNPISSICCWRLLSQDKILQIQQPYLLFQSLDYDKLAIWDLLLSIQLLVFFLYTNEPEMYMRRIC